MITHICTYIYISYYTIIYQIKLYYYIIILYWSKLQLQLMTDSAQFSTASRTLGWAGWPQKKTLYYIISYYIILHYIIYHIILHYIILCYIILYYVTLCYIMLHYVIISYYITLYYIILYQYTPVFRYVIHARWGLQMKSLPWWTKLQQLRELWQLYSKRLDTGFMFTKQLITGGANLLNPVRNNIIAQDIQKKRRKRSLQ